ncbi:hypothetical protein GIB67_042714 [Kingdonia uniflora]|uniref:Transposase n=1 Tax=Kingdonia uniflora TaxID=39325 RepID=A0A7J7NEK6_9MAGN|nr:hypothetical protein GIB67_042714 [Kingdonia uniflora]
MGNKWDPLYDENDLWINTVPKEVLDLAGEDTSILKIDLQMVEDELDNKNKELAIKNLKITNKDQEYSKIPNTILRRMAHYNPFDNLQSPGDDSNTVDTGSKPLPNGKKKKIDVNSWGQPNQANSETNTYTSDIEFQVRMHLPIIYESFKDVHNDRIVLVVKGLEECYDIFHLAWFDLKEKIKDSWRRYKYRFNTTLIARNNLGDVKASPASEFVPREDWVKFVDYCNSEKFIAKSKRSKENQAKLIAPCTLGRTSMPITRHKLAEERGVTDEEIGRVEVYIPAHTKKVKTIQCPDVIAKLQNTMQKDPQSIRTGPNDAISQVFNVIELIIEIYYYLSIYSYIHIYTEIWQREEKWNSGYKDDQDVRSASDMVFRSEGLLHTSKLKCRLEALPAIRGTIQLGSNFRVFPIHFLKQDKRLR